jgi:hypothetical protein
MRVSPWLRLFLRREFGHRDASFPLEFASYFDASRDGHELCEMPLDNLRRVP